MRIIFLGLILLSVNSYAHDSRKVTAGAAGAAIPVAYDAANAQSLVAVSAQSHSNVYLKNTSTSDIACKFSGNAAVAPTSATNGTESIEILVPASSDLLMRGKKTSPALYCRSASGSTITSGNLYFNAW